MSQFTKVSMDCPLSPSQDQRKLREHQERYGLSNMEEFGQTLRESRSDVKRREDELRSVKDRLAVMEEFYKLHLHGVDLTEMGTHYEEKLKEARTALKEKEDEFQSFKDRVAADIASSIKTGDTVSMNDPVSKDKLIKMYDELRLKKWPKVKDNLESSGRQLEDIKYSIRKVYGDAGENIERKIEQIHQVFQLSEHLSGPTCQKVRELRQLTINNLQLAVYHSKDHLLQSIHSNPSMNLAQDQDKNELSIFLHSECYWLGCLMTLNNPPLQPDWENHHPANRWDIFPQNIR